MESPVASTAREAFRWKKLTINFHSHGKAPRDFHSTGGLLIS